MHDNELKYWLALKMVEGVGNVAFTAIVKTFGSPKEVFDAPFNSLKEMPGIGKKVASQIKSFSNWQQVEKELAAARNQQVSIITCHDPLYPINLLNIYDFPPFLYVKGSLKEEDINIAVVGSRMASTYGKFSTERLCRELAINGITVVSGLARGIDTAAHRGSIAAKGRTIAVLGCGIDIVYPPENKELFTTIPLQGAIITEFPFGTPPNGPNFPARNRIISGLSLGVVVVEANEKSGSLITARTALEQGREVFAVPGSVDSAGSRGTNGLIKQGAKLIEDVYDILDEIMPQIEMKQKIHIPEAAEKTKSHKEIPPAACRTSGNEDLTDKERNLLERISASPVTIDSLIAQTGERPGEILNNLLLLELKGLITQLPGKMFIL
ncbi:MAG TPA: DNA-processing protein DprA, partial [Syntrophales bacterium]|nr:DNA-processing protein DprA [Syntrophales bacterium]